MLTTCPFAKGFPCIVENLFQIWDASISSEEEDSVNKDAVIKKYLATKANCPSISVLIDYEKQFLWKNCTLKIHSRVYLQDVSKNYLYLAPTRIVSLLSLYLDSQEGTAIYWVNIAVVTFFSTSHLCVHLKWQNVADISFSFSYLSIT